MAKKNNSYGVGKRYSTNSNKYLSSKKRVTIVSYEKVTRSLNTIYRSEIDDINRFVSFVEKVKSY